MSDNSQVIVLDDIYVWTEDVFVSSLDPIVYNGSNGTIINYGNGMHIGRFTSDLDSGSLDSTSFIKVVPLNGVVDVVANCHAIADSEEEFSISPSECWIISPGLDYVMQFDAPTDILIQVLDNLES